MTKSIIAALLLVIGSLVAGQTLNHSGTASTVPSQSKSEGTNVNNQTPYNSVFPQHEAYGASVGAMPGRVIWVHNPKSVDWNGEGYWWQITNLDETVISRMVADGIVGLAGKADVKSGWDALFFANNASRGRQGGYRRGMCTE